MNGYNKIICGHTHLPEYTEKYINTGSFCEKNASYVIINKNNQIKLININDID